MTIELNEIVRLQDCLNEVQKGAKALTDVCNIMQYGFTSVADDNGNFTISALKVIEELLRILDMRLSEALNTVDTMINQDKV